METMSLIEPTDPRGEANATEEVVFLYLLINSTHYSGRIPSVGPFELPVFLGKDRIETVVPVSMVRSCAWLTF